MPVYTVQQFYRDDKSSHGYVKLLALVIRDSCSSVKGTDYQREET